jgi:tetratricopeptide (TPR) repeat protein
MINDTQREDANMTEPTTAAETLAFHKLRKSDPQRAAQIASRWLENDPTSATALYSRHVAWMELGDTQRALDDLDNSIELHPHPMSYLSRAEVYRHIGEYEKAIDDFGRGEAMDPARWRENAIPLLYQADTYARLGDEIHALACCAKLPDHFWTPGPDGTPAGGKAEIAHELTRRAARATRQRS